MGNSCCRKKSCSTNGSKRTGNIGQFNYIGEPAIDVDNSINGTNELCSDSSDIERYNRPESRQTVCSQADVTAFFEVEPKEHVDDDDDDDKGPHNVAPTKTTMVFIKLGAAHNIPSAQNTHDTSISCKSAEHSKSPDRDTKSKTSHFTLSANAGCANEAFLCDNPNKYRCVELNTHRTNKTPGAPEEKRPSPDKAVFSQSKPLEVSRYTQKSPAKIFALPRNEGSHTSESNVGAIPSHTETDSQVLRKYTVPESSKESTVTPDGQAQVRVGPSYGQRSQNGSQDADEDLYPMYDVDMSSSDGVEADRDLNEIWTEIEMIEENICCIRDCDVDTNVDSSTLYEMILQNVRDLTKTRDSLAEFVRVESEEEEQTNDDVVQRKRATYETYETEVGKLNVVAAKALLQKVLKKESEISLRGLLEKHNRTQARLRRRREEQRTLAQNDIAAKLRMNLTQRGENVVNFNGEADTSVQKESSDDEESVLSYFEDEDDTATTDVSEDETKRGRAASVQVIDVADVATGMARPHATVDTQTRFSSDPKAVSHDTLTVDLLTVGDKDFIDRIMRERNNNEKVSEMIKEHVQSMKTFRSRRKDFTSDHAQKLQEKLRAQINKKRRVGPVNDNTAMTESTTASATDPDGRGRGATQNSRANQTWTPVDQDLTVAKAQYKPHFEEIGIQWSDEHVRACSGQSPDEGSRECQLYHTYSVSPASNWLHSEQSSASSSSISTSDVRSPVFQSSLSTGNQSDIGLKLTGSSGDCSRSVSNVDAAFKAAIAEADAGRLEKQLLASVAGVDSVTREELEALLVTFYENQTNVMRDFQLDRQNFDQELLRRLRSLTQDNNSGDASPNSMLSDKSSGTPSASVSVNKRVGEMDDNFLEWLGKIRAAENLSVDQVQQLVQQHLQVVAEFKASMKNEFAKLRQEMQDCSRAESKLSSREKRLQALSPVNPIDVDSFVDHERQQAARLRQLRYDERERTNTLLREKLKRQKQLRERKRSSQALVVTES